MSRPLTINSPTKLRNIGNKYFKECDKSHKPYTISGLAFALGINRRTLLEYSKRDEFSPTISLFKAKIEEQLEVNMLTGASKGAPSQFVLKNNFGWKDQQDVVATVTIKAGKLHEIPTDKLIEMVGLDDLTQVEQGSKGFMQMECDSGNTISECVTPVIPSTPSDNPDDMTYNTPITNTTYDAPVEPS